MSSSLLTEANPNPIANSSNPPIANNPSESFRCYLRQPDMHSIIHNISPEQSISSIKQKVKELFNLNHINDLDSIKLVVNEIELAEGVDLNEHLFNNAIVHVVVVISRSQEEQRQEQQESEARTKLLALRIKEPPVNCPIYTIQNISPSQSVKSLKSTILSYYKSEHPQNSISQLNENELYLVYGGRVLVDSKCLEEYGVVDETTGIVYVVNGRVYVKEVTKEEAERRINEVKRGNYALSEEVKQEEQVNKEEQLDSEIHPEEANDLIVEYEFNIIQNIVHDSDSEVEGETANDLARSQKFIQRYNSITQNDNGEEEEEGEKDEKELGYGEEREEETEEQPIVTEEQSFENQQPNNPSQNNIPFISGNEYKTIDMVIKEDKDNEKNEYEELSWESRMEVDKYLDYVNHQVADYQAMREVVCCNEGELNNGGGEGEQEQEEGEEQEQQQHEQQELLKTTETTETTHLGFDQLNDNGNINNDEMLI